MDGASGEAAYVATEVATDEATDSCHGWRWTCGVNWCGDMHADGSGDDGGRRIHTTINRWKMELCVAAEEAAEAATEAVSEDVIGACLG